MVPSSGTRCTKSCCKMGEACPDTSPVCGHDGTGKHRHWQPWMRSAGRISWLGGGWQDQGSTSPVAGDKQQKPSNVLKRFNDARRRQIRVRLCRHARNPNGRQSRASNHHGTWSRVPIRHGPSRDASQIHSSNIRYRKASHRSRDHKGRSRRHKRCWCRRDQSCMPKAETRKQQRATSRIALSFCVATVKVQA